MLKVVLSEGESLSWTGSLGDEGTRGGVLSHPLRLFLPCIFPLDRAMSSLMQVNLCARLRRHPDIFPIVLYDRR